jgi:hypothetical protein
VAACTLGAAAATGLSAQVGLVDTSGVRWVHHGLYAASIAACAMAALADLVGPGRRRGAMVPSLVGLAVLSRTDGGTVRHAAVASAAVCCAGIDLVRTR